MKAAERQYLWPTTEQELILTAAIAPERAAVEAFAHWNDNADYERHFDNGVFRLLPLAYRRMAALGVKAGSMPRLKGVYRQAWCNTQILFHGVAPALALLQANDIEILLLKGAPLLSLYYKGIGLRPMADVDIAVRRADMAQAVSLLRNANWGVREKELQVIRVSDVGTLDLLLQQHHGFQFKNAEGHEIDLHHHLLKDAFTASADAWFWNASVPYTFLGMQMRRLDATALLFHTIVHGLRPNPDPPIRWIADAHAILAEASAEIRWSDMITFAREQSLSHRLYLGLAYLAQKFAVPVPGEVLLELRSATTGFTEWAERKYVFDLERPDSLIGWICSVVAGEARRSRDAGRLVFLARVSARVQRFLRRRLKSALAGAGG